MKKTRFNLQDLCRRYRYMTITLSEGNERGYEAVIPKFPKLWIFADTPKQLHELVLETIADELEYRRKNGLPIPTPDSASPGFSGKILLRMSPELHQRLSLLAQADEKTLNGYISNILEGHVGERKILAKSEK